MKSYTPPQRLLDLGIVLQYDQQACRFFAPHERFSINYERARLMANDYSISQCQSIENKIYEILTAIERQDWCPFSEIKYS